MPKEQKKLKKDLTADDTDLLADAAD